ncbi:MAG: fatty acid desaturase [Proteobacteria bacterium]|nr:fatty acid desaturase [Pseudomonadota bacterium]MCP4921029.1 fatty acid desaturase [Pseudomonadota bacterium]
MVDSRKVRLEVDTEAFATDVEQLKKELDALRGPEDARQLQKVVWFTRVMQVVGWLTAWIPLNPVSFIALSLSRTVRWTSVAHHVCHRGYDKVDGMPDRLTSRGFAKGWRRFLDWPDLLEPEAWKREHNQLHHYRLGEIYDPDVVELNAGALLHGMGRTMRLVSIVGIALTWKWLYYAPSNIRELEDFRKGHKLPPEREERMDERLLFPWTEYGKLVWLRCYLPYGLLTFVVMPLLFLPFGWEFSVAALVNSVIAEVLSNLHTFVIVVTNHAGSDILRFEGKTQGRPAFYIRQVTGSVNFRTGGFWNDVMHGWLNYQIEHHVWPDLSMRQYVLAQPRLKAICEKHQVPYLQESVFRRVRRLVNVMMGDEVSPVLDESTVTDEAA